MASELLKEFIQRYDEKRREFISSLYPDSPWHRELLKSARLPGAVEIIDKEQAFYAQMLEDMIDLRDFRCIETAKEDWLTIVAALKNHNERFSEHLENWGALAAFFAFISAVIAILAREFSPQNWIVFGLIFWATIQLYPQRIAVRNDVTRNKEIINIIEANIHKLSRKHVGYPQKEESLT